LGAFTPIHDLRSYSAEWW